MSVTEADNLPIGTVLCDTHLSDEDRALGVLLSCMIGDVLGAAVEGHSAKDIAVCYPDGLRNFIYAAHMGVYHLGLRRGTYTDDTQSTLALAWSLVERQGLDPNHVAHAYAEFYHHQPQRGYPGSAIAVLKAVEQGEDIHKTGTTAFPDGSFANGGAMRIAPIGVAFRNATDDQLYEAVRLAIISSHVHPQAIDGAFLIAKAITLMLKTKVEDVNVIELLNKLLSLCKTKEMKEKLNVVIENLPKADTMTDDEERKFIKLLGTDFQICAVDAVAVVLWGFARHYRNPENAIIQVVRYGGDTDTTACICGGLLGALHGASWIPGRWWSNLRNDEYGRDWTVALARNLVKLNLSLPLST